MTRLADQAVRAVASINAPARPTTIDEAEAWEPPLHVAEEGLERAERFYEKSLEGPDW